MAGINKVILVGNLGADPEIRSLENGAKVATISIATTESYKDKAGNWQEQTEWHRVVLWRWLAEKAENMKKGSKVYIEGSLKTRQWTDRDNITRYTTEIVADKSLLLDKREGGAGNFAPSPTAADAPAQHTQNTTTATTEVSKPAEATPDIPKTDAPGDDLPF